MDQLEVDVQLEIPQGYYFYDLTTGIRRSKGPNCDRPLLLQMSDVWPVAYGSDWHGSRRVSIAPIPLPRLW